VGPDWGRVATEWSRSTKQAKTHVIYVATEWLGQSLKKEMETETESGIVQIFK